MLANGSSTDRSITPSARPQTFIPDLCHRQAVFRIVLATQLFAILVTLVQQGPGVFNWENLALTSLFMQWIALTSSAVLCAFRGRLSHWHPARQAQCAYGLLLLFTLLCAIAAEFIRTKTGPSAPPVFYAAPPVRIEFLIHCVLISAIAGAVGLRYLYLQHERYHDNQVGLEARIQALQARIKPHFLFNSMNSIAELIAVDADKAEESVLDLAELFRAALRQDADLAPLKEELKLCRSYLRIEALRLGHRLQLSWQIEPDCDNLRVPPLILQPLVENAIYHGIQPLPDGGTLSVSAYRQNDALYLQVSNPLNTQNDQLPKHEGNRIALDNIRHRLQAHYGPRSAIKTSQQDHTYHALIRIPLDNLQEPSHS